MWETKMSWEVFGTSGDNDFDIDQLYDHGWESDEDGEKWWKYDSPEEVYTLEEAVENYTDMGED
jgi:hypothetical protein